MNDRELLYIKTIAELHNISKASEKLFVSQPSLSKCLSNVENVIGTKLFKRTTEGLIPTLAGESYYKMACEILKRYNDFQVEISDINSLQKGSITIGTTMYLGSCILPIVLPLFKKSCPNIEVNVLEMNSTVLKKSLLSGMLDFAFMHTMYGENSSTDDSLSFYPLLREPFLLVTKKDHPLSRYGKYISHSPYKRMDLTIFSGEPFVLLNRKKKIGQISGNILGLANISPPVVLTTDNYVTAKRLASVGIGSTFLPQYYMKLFRDDYPSDCFSLDPKLKPYWVLGIGIKKGSYVSKASRILIKIAEENVSLSDIKL